MVRFPCLTMVYLDRRMAVEQLAAVVLKGSIVDSGSVGLAEIVHVDALVGLYLDIEVVVVRGDDGDMDAECSRIRETAVFRFPGAIRRYNYRWASIEPQRTSFLLH